MKQNSPVALVTGSARRIGAAIVEHLHQAGYNVVIHCHRSVDEANGISDRLNQIRPESAYVCVADLRLKPENVKLIHESIHWGGRLDVLVNNASIFMPSLMTHLDEELWNSLLTLNVRSPYWLSLTAREALDAQKGVIINITDIHADTPLKGYSEYCQTKAALAMQTKALAREFAPNIRVNAIAPGAISWPEGDNFLNTEQQQTIIERTLLKRHGEPIFIAQAVLSMVENPFITGQSLRVDGGRSV